MYQLIRWVEDTSMHGCISEVVGGHAMKVDLSMERRDDR